MNVLLSSPLGALLAQPWVDVVLSGAVTPEQLLSNVGAVDRQLSAEQVTDLAKLAESPDAYWRARSQLPWT